MGKSTRKSLQRREQDDLREVIRQARLETGISQRQLSQKLGFPLTYIARIERGERTVDIVEFLDIAAKLNRDPLEMLKEVIDLTNGREPN